MSRRKLAIVTGASSGIGLELAKLAAHDGYDLIVAADEPLGDASAALKNLGVEVQSVEADLATADRRLALAAGDRAIVIGMAGGIEEERTGYRPRSPSWPSWADAGAYLAELRASGVPPTRVRDPSPA